MPERNDVPESVAAVRAEVTAAQLPPLLDGLGAVVPEGSVSIRYDVSARTAVIRGFCAPDAVPAFKAVVAGVKQPEGPVVQ